MNELRKAAPPLVQQLLPIVDQIRPILDDVADGRQEFTPSPDESMGIIKRNYRVSQNLVIRFTDDGIDEGRIDERTLHSYTM